MPPQVRTLDQILSEIGSVYEPQVQSIKQRQAAIPGQIQAEQKGLQAKQEQSFGDILSGARRRGLGFSGIPLGEQAKYTATEYLPALARLQQSGREQAMSLEDAILGIRERQQNQALGMRQYEQQRFDAYQQQQEQLRAQQRAAAAQRAAFAPTLGGGSSEPRTPSGGRQETSQLLSTPGNWEDRQAENEVVAMFDSGDLARIQREIAAIEKSARYGNQKDRYKLIHIARLGGSPTVSGNAFGASSF